MGTNSHIHHHHQPSHLLTKKIISRVIYILIPLALLHFYLSPLSLSPNQPPPQHPQPITNIITQLSPLLPSPQKTQPPPPKCDYSVGQWVPTTKSPLYNGTTCKTIKDGQNCMVHGRPDTNYLFYRWRPINCHLGPFNPLTFLSLIRNQHLAFIGDSMARNQLESLLCLLSTYSNPELVYSNGEDNKFRRWVFGSHNVTISVFWSPFLVDGEEKSAASGLNHNKLFLERVDKKWASELGKIDLVVLSTGHWFLHPALYYENDQVIGCHHCPEFNHTEIGFFEVFRKAVRTALKGVRENNSGVKFVTVTTFSPAHFEGEWDKAGACPRKEPYKEGEKEMEYMDKEMRRVEVEEVMAAAEEEKEGGEVEIEALDVTAMAMLRADGHPGPYMYPNPFGDGEVKERVQNDCVHWCLPGPIDTWNEILLEKVKRWKEEKRGDLV